MSKIIVNSLLGLWSSVKIVYFGEYVPNEEEITDGCLYADNVRQWYSEKLGWPKIDLTYQDKYYYRGKKNDLLKCSKLFQEQYGESCRSKNGWVIPK